MDMNGYMLTEKEHQITNRRAEEVFKTVKESVTVTEGLCRYAAANGFSEEEAKGLIMAEVVSTVDEYNVACRRQLGHDNLNWIQENLSNRMDGMTVGEECQYKLMLTAILQKAGKEALATQAGMESEAELEMEYGELSQPELFEQGEFNEEMLEQINENLAEAIKHSGMELEMLSRFERFIEDRADKESIHGFAMDLWKDEQYKYCAAVAVCVAKKNGELPSIPEETPLKALIIGVCQGVDVANVEMQVAAGQMASDEAVQVLSFIISVGLLLLLAAGAFGFSVLFEETIFEIMGENFAGMILGSVVGAAFFLLFAADINDALMELKDEWNEVRDITWDKLKWGGESIHSLLCQYAVPAIKKMVEKTEAFFEGIISRFHRVKSREKLHIKNA